MKKIKREGEEEEWMKIKERRWDERRGGRYAEDRTGGERRRNKGSERWRKSEAGGRGKQKEDETEGGYTRGGREERYAQITLGSLCFTPDCS